MSGPAVQATHAVKLAVTVGGHKGPLYVVECTCGWSSQLHQGQDEARIAWRRHVGTVAP